MFWRSRRVWLLQGKRNDEKRTCYSCCSLQEIQRMRTGIYFNNVLWIKKICERKKTMPRKNPSIRSLLRNQCGLLTTDDAGVLWFWLRSCHCLLKQFRGRFTQRFLETVLQMLPNKMMIQLWESLSPHLIFVPDKERPNWRSPYDEYISPDKILGYFFLTI